METIVLSPDLQITVTELAEQQSKSVDEVLHDALGRYAQEQQLKKLDREIAVYETLHPQLKEKYFGEWVAIHAGELVDHDADHVAIHRRIRNRFGKIAVLIRQVGEQPITEIWFRTVSTGKIVR